jgi:microcompartment protein CcmK/EutM
MYIGQVVGNVVATIKHEAFLGRKLLLVDRLDLAGKQTGEYDICVDVAQAGVGDRVLVIDEGNGARQILNREIAPVRAVIVGVIDEVELVEPAEPEQRPAASPAQPVQKKRRPKQDGSGRGRAKAA